MRELFLLGAGASVEAGIPDTYRMTELMLDKFKDLRRDRRIFKVLQFVVGGLLFQRGIHGENPYGGVSIEDLFNSVIMLADRQNSEIGPFISSWHPQIVGLESGELSGRNARELLGSIYEPVVKYMQDLAKNPQNRGAKKIDTFYYSSDFEYKFTSAVRQVMTGSEGKLFSTTAESMIQKLVDMVWIDDVNKVSYLIPLISHAKEYGSYLTTLNYDNAIELTGSNLGIEIDTGFDSWSKSGDFLFTENRIPLLKLHGSIDWALSDGQISKDKPIPFQIIQKVDLVSKEKRNFHPAVVFGGKNKLTAKGPFLSLLRAFDQQLSRSEILWVIGYSFRDEHVNEFIINWFNANPTRIIKIINPKPESMNHEFTRHFHGFANDRIIIIPESAANGINNFEYKQ